MKVIRSKSSNAIAILAKADASHSLKQRMILALKVTGSLVVYHPATKFKYVVAVVENSVTKKKENVQVLEPIYPKGFTAKNAKVVIREGEPMSYIAQADIDKWYPLYIKALAEFGTIASPTTVEVRSKLLKLAETADKNMMIENHTYFSRGENAVTFAYHKTVAANKDRVDFFESLEGDARKQSQSVSHKIEFLNVNSKEVQPYVDAMNNAITKHDRAGFMEAITAIIDKSPDKVITGDATDILKLLEDVRKARK